MLQTSVAKTGMMGQEFREPDWLVVCVEDLRLLAQLGVRIKSCQETIPNVEAENSEEVVEEVCECFRLAEEGLSDVDHGTELLSDLLLIEDLVSNLIQASSRQR